MSGAPETPRTAADIRAEIHDMTGDDYPVLGLLVDLENVVVREARAEALREVGELREDLQTLAHLLGGESVLTPYRAECEVIVRRWRKRLAARG